jgi:hypothetical protein
MSMVRAALLASLAALALAVTIQAQPPVTITLVRWPFT